MYFPEQHIGGLWSINEHEKDTTLVDIKKREAFVPKDMTPIFIINNDRLGEYGKVTIETEVVPIEGAKCDKRKVLCKQTLDKNYIKGICEHHSYAAKILRSEDDYQNQKRWRKNASRYTYGYAELKKYNMPIRELSMEDNYSYSKHYIRLGIDLPHTVLTIDTLRNASAYLDLQKQLPKIRKYDGFTELDWTSLYNLLKQIHLQRNYWWYDRHIVEEPSVISDVAKQIIASKVTMACLNPNDDALVNLYYELINSVFTPYSIKRLLYASAGNTSSMIPYISEGKLNYLKMQDYVIKHIPGVTDAQRANVGYKIEFLHSMMTEAQYAKNHLQSGLERYGKITTTRYKQAARMIASGLIYAKRYADKHIIKSSVANLESLMKYTDTQTAKYLADKTKAVDDAKFMADFRLFQAKYVDGSSYTGFSNGNVPVTRTAHSGGQYRWGDLAIIQEPLTKNLKHKLKGATHKPNEYGVIPHYTDRYFSDKRLFRIKKNIKGGTVLIDASGSMSLSEDDIFKILESLPAGVVAMYSGTSSYYRTGKNIPRGNADGELNIIAKNQRMVGKLPRSFGENVVDYPALIWLSKMPKPRIWVSDEEVTMLRSLPKGKTTEANAIPEGKAQCKKLVKRAGIITLRNIDAVIDFAKSMKRQ